MKVKLAIGMFALCAACSQEEPPALDPGCRAPDGVSASPRSLVEVVALIDALPQPVTVPCFVQSLDRPLKIIASDSTFSAQPAAQGSPRIFGILDTLIISWVPMGDGSKVLEFAEERPNGLSLKAELAMPLEGPVTYDDFAHINQPADAEREGTFCGGCHQNEQPGEDIGLGGPFYASEALRPSTAETVRVQPLRDLHEFCDPELDEMRCEIFSATFDFGDVIDEDFPRSLPTIYD